MRKKYTYLIIVLLIVASCAVFSRIAGTGFITFDDNIYVTDNSHVQSGMTLDGLRWAFNTTYAAFWHPLTWVSLMLDNQFFGMNAGGYHVTNLILHILTTLLLFGLLNRMTGETWKSAFVAALFALHPLHVESVAWISKRKDVLSAFFWMLTLCLYVWYAEKPALKKYFLVLCSFLAALMSKPMAVTLPVVMILLDYWPLRRFASQKGDWVLWQLKEKAALFVLSAVFSIVTLFAHSKPNIENIPLALRLANAPVSFVTYLGKTFWPRDMAVFYPFTGNLPPGHVLVSILLIIVISAAVMVAVKRLPYLFVGWFWYMITVLPVSGIIQVNLRAMSDNYTYLPSIGVFMMIAWGIPFLFKSRETGNKVLFPAGIAFLIILSGITWHQCGYWKNSITLFEHALRVTKNNDVAHSCLGVAYYDEGKIKEAIDQYSKGILITQDNADLYYNRGLAYAGLGQNQYALGDFNQAIRLNPDNAWFYNNRGSAYDRLGQPGRALEDYNAAILLNQDYAQAYYNRGTAYAELGRYQNAIEDFNRAIMIKPDFPDAYYNRGAVYLLQGNRDTGCRDAQKACEMGNCRLLEEYKKKTICR